MLKERGEKEEKWGRRLVRICEAGKRGAGSEGRKEGAREEGREAEREDLSLFWVRSCGVEMVRDPLVQGTQSGRRTAWEWSDWQTGPADVGLCEVTGKDRTLWRQRTPAGGVQTASLPASCPPSIPAG